MSKIHVVHYLSIVPARNYTYIYNNNKKKTKRKKKRLLFNYNPVDVGFEKEIMINVSIFDNLVKLAVLKPENT